jgi:hypothetical protein
VENAPASARDVFPLTTTDANNQFAVAVSSSTFSEYWLLCRVGGGIGLMWWSMSIWRKEFFRDFQGLCIAMSVIYA